MHAGQNTKMKRGAIWACAIPVGLGLIALIFLLLSTREMAILGSNYLNHFFTIFPIIACFLFGAPLSAWLACRSLKKIRARDTLSRWRASAVRGFLSASVVHFVWAAAYTIGVSIVAMRSQYVTFQELDPEYNVVSSMLFSSMFVNLFLWIIITLPLSLLCATIFWKVTKFPENTDVF